MCDDCIHSQATLNSIKYVRIGNVADVMIVACPKHLQMFKNTFVMMNYESLEDIREIAKQESNKKT